MFGFDNFAASKNTHDIELDTNKLPYVPPHFFYYQFSSGAKRMFWFMMLALVLASSFTLFSFHKPYHWVIDILEVSEGKGEVVKVAEAQSGYQSFDIQSTAYRQTVNYIASAMSPKAFPVLLFWAFQLIGWATLLASSTFIRSRWYLLFFGLFGLFLHFSGISKFFYAKDTYYIVELAGISCFLGLGYFLQKNNLKWAFPYRFLLILGMLVALFGFVWLKNDWTALHKIGVNIYPYLCVIGVVFLFFIAKEPTNLILLAATNHKSEENRRSFTQILIAFFVLLALEALMIFSYIDFGGITLETTTIRAIHLIAIAGIATVFTSQNQFHNIKEALSSVTVFSFLILSWALISLSSFFFSASTGDSFYIHIIERLAAVFFFFAALGHLVFLFMELRPLLMKKINVYYIIAQGQSIRFIMVWLMAAIGMVLAEGKDDWKTAKMMIGTYLMHQGDIASMEGEVAFAKYSYEKAKMVEEFSPRLNYNLASLCLRAKPDDVMPAIKCYKDANAVQSFPYAVLNQGNLYMVANQFENATKLWNTEINKHPNAQIANNLGMLYWSQKKADAAIGAMKKALKADPSLSAAYSNLANIYWENNDKKFAREFVKASLNVSNPSSLTVSNAIWFSFKDSTLAALEMPALKATKESDFIVQNNYALYLLKKDKSEEAAPWLNELSKMDSTELQCFIAYQWFLQDSVVKARSKADFLSTISPKYQSQANYLMGVAALQKGIPEMAKVYFRKMTEAGDSTGLYYEGLAMARSGLRDSAAMKLNLARAAKPEMGDKIGREMALLQKSAGQDHFAQLEYDLNKLTAKDYLRAGIYADSSNNFIYATQAFREAIAKDSSSALPYLELGKIFNKYRNIQAIENLNYGLKRFSDNIHLKTELVKAYIYQNKAAEAEKILAEVKKKEPKDFYVRLAIAELAASKADTATCFPLFKELNKEEPCNQEVVLAMAAQLLKANRNNVGYDWMYKALQINSENAGIWYYLAHFTRKWGLSRDAGFDALKAISLTQSEGEKQQIQREFDREIKEVLGTLNEDEEKKPELVEIK